MQTSDRLKSAKTELLRAFALAITENASDQNGQKNTQPVRFDTRFEKKEQ